MSWQHLILAAVIVLNIVVAPTNRDRETEELVVSSLISFALLGLLIWGQS